MKIFLLLASIVIFNSAFAEEFITFNGKVDKICGYNEIGCNRLTFQLGKDVKASFTIYKQGWLGGKTAIVVGPEKVKNNLPFKQVLYYSFALFDKKGRYITGGGDRLDVDISKKEKDGFQSLVVIPKTKLDKIKKYSISLYTYKDKK